MATVTAIIDGTGSMGEELHVTELSCLGVFFVRCIKSEAKVLTGLGELTNQSRTSEHVSSVKRGKNSENKIAIGVVLYLIGWKQYVLALIG